MTRSGWVTRITKAILWIVPGTTLLGTSCGVEVRNSLIGATADFAGDSLTILLGALLPIEDWVNPDAT